MSNNEIEASYPSETTRMERKSRKVDPPTRRNRLLHNSFADILRGLIGKYYPIRHINQTLPPSNFRRFRSTQLVLISGTHFKSFNDIKSGRLIRSPQRIKDFSPKKSDPCPKDVEKLCLPKSHTLNK